jgi:hypothetical protein
MAGKWKVTIQAATIVVLGGIVAAGLILSCHKRPNTLQGAVIERNSDPRKESPVADVEVTATIGSTSMVTRTGSSGYFTFILRRWVIRGQAVSLKFRRAGYEPLDLNETVSDQLYVVHMMPLPSKVQSEPKQPPVGIANVKIRYSVRTTGAVSVGSAVKTFEVVNTGNVPCDNHPPCSPNGKWKAAIASIGLDAGEGNEFRNARLSCIAGPCPFTKIESDDYSEGGNKISASILNWSDTTTFLLEAELYHPMETDIIRETHPAIFGRTLNFSVPGTAEGQSIEADVNGEAIVFPLGPSLCLSWADCTVVTDKNQNKTYRCELKGGYQFR